MSQRSIVTDKMRAILVDWLIQVHNRFRLLQETLYITVSILDRFLSVSLNHLLLVNQNPFSKLLLLLLSIIPPLYQKSALSFFVIFVDLTVNKENQQWLEMRYNFQQIIDATGFSCHGPDRKAQLCTVISTEQCICTYFLKYWSDLLNLFFSCRSMIPQRKNFN